MPSFVVVTALIGLVLLLAATVRSNARSGLDRIPAAHFTVPFSRLWILMIRWRSIENRTRIEIHRRLGPVVRIGPREVSVDCVEDGTRLIFSSNFEKDKRLYGMFVDDVPFLVTMIGNNEHKKRKRMLSHVYSKSHVLNSQVLDDAMTQVIGRLKEELSSWASENTSVDILAGCKACLLDITIGWLYGTENSTDTLRDEVSRKELFSWFEPKFDDFFWRYEFSWLLKILPRLGINTTSKSAQHANDSLRQWFAQIHAGAHSAHDEKPAPAANVYDYLYDNLKRDDPEMSHSAVDAIMTAELDDHLIAGYHATGIAVTYAIYELSSNMRIQRMLREELRTLAEPSNRSLAQRIEELRILDAVVVESLRVWSPNPGPWARVVPDSGCRIAGSFDVPAGTIVSSSSWTLHRNPVVFSSPEKWRPDRWLEADEPTQHDMRRWMWAFGSGARMCIGSHFALRCFKEILAALYVDYETLLDQSSTGNMDQLDALIAGPAGNCLNIQVRRYG